MSRKTKAPKKTRVAQEVLPAEEDESGEKQGTLVDDPELDAPAGVEKEKSAEKEVATLRGKS